MITAFVEESILSTIEEKLRGMTYDLVLLLTHYPLLGTDIDVFMNSRSLIDFVNSQKIEFVFCGHDHFLRLENTCDHVCQSSILPFYVWHDSKCQYTQG